MSEHDRITESQEWIDGLVVKYSPIADAVANKERIERAEKRQNDIDVAIQNMGLHIAELEQKLKLIREQQKEDWDRAEKAERESAELRNAIEDAMSMANNRWDEWGERAISVADILDAVRYKDAEKG